MTVSSAAARQQVRALLASLEADAAAQLSAPSDMHYTVVWPGLTPLGQCHAAAVDALRATQSCIPLMASYPYHLPEAMAPSSNAEVARLFESTQARFITELSGAGVSAEAARLIEARLVQLVEVRVRQLYAQLRRDELAIEESTAAETSATLNSDPAAPRSAAELAAELGLSEKTVHQRTREGKLLAVLRAGRQRGAEYPAFQAWPSVAGAPLEGVLEAWRSAATAAFGSASQSAAARPAIDAAAVVQFFLAPTDLLGGVTPVEALVGRLTRERDVGDSGLALLRASAADRLEAVRRTAQTVAIEDASQW